MIVAYRSSESAPAVGVCDARSSMANNDVWATWSSFKDDVTYFGIAIGLSRRVHDGSRGGGGT